MKRKLAAVVMTLVLLLGLPFQAFAQETTQPTQAAQTAQTAPVTQPAEPTAPVASRIAPTHTGQPTAAAS